MLSKEEGISTHYPQDGGCVCKILGQQSVHEERVVNCRKVPEAVTRVMPLSVATCAYSAPIARVLDTDIVVCDTGGLPGGGSVGLVGWLRRRRTL